MQLKLNERKTPTTTTTMQLQLNKTTTTTIQLNLNERKTTTTTTMQLKLNERKTTTTTMQLKLSASKCICMEPRYAWGNSHSEYHYQEIRKVITQHKSNSGMEIGQCENL